MTKVASLEKSRRKKTCGYLIATRIQHWLWRQRLRIFLIFCISFVVAQIFLLPRLAGSVTKTKVARTENTRSNNDDDDENYKILYVHIGKTGGEFLKSQLRISCKTRKDKKLRQECFLKFASSPGRLPYLSQYTTGYLHTSSLHPPKNRKNAGALLMDDYTHYLFTVRHPLSRFKSWYIYNHPRSCDMREPHSPSCKSNDWKRQFFQCFPTFQSFADNSNNDCHTVLWNGWHGQHVSSVKEPNHLYWNYQYYWNQTLADIPASGPSSIAVWVLRQESLTEDALQLESKIGKDTATKQDSNDRRETFFPVESQHYIKASLDITHKDSLLSNTQKRYLCICILPKEISIYQRLIQRAQNLSPMEKENTFVRLLQECGSPLGGTWDDWWADAAREQPKLCGSHIQGQHQ